MELTPTRSVNAYTFLATNLVGEPTVHDRSSERAYVVVFSQHGGQD